MNITTEPIKWFNLITACGLADVSATSLHDLLERDMIQLGMLPMSLPSVKDVARGLIPRFAKMFNRVFLDLTGDVESGGDGDDGKHGSEELRQLRNMVNRAEEEAKRINEASKGWAKEPDLSR